MTAIPDKMEMTMHEFKHGQLHSGSKKGPKVTSRAQAIAIGLNQQRKAEGMAEGGPVMGFDSQSPVVKGDNPVRAYADGGDVGIPDDSSSDFSSSDDSQDPDTGSSLGTGEASMGGGSQMGGDSAMGALQQAMTYGMQKYGLTDDSAGAVNTPEDGQNVHTYLSGGDAYHPNDVAAAEQAVDPTGQMSPADRHLAVIEQSAPEDAHGVIQSDRKQHMGFAAGAIHALSQGDFSTAAQYAMEALNSIPSRFNIQVQWFPPASEKDQNSNPDLASAAAHGIPGIVSGLANSNAGKQLGQDLGAIGSAIKSVLPLQENAASFTQGTDQRNYEDMSPYVVQPRQLGTGDSSLPSLETANATSKSMPVPGGGAMSGENDLPAHQDAKVASQSNPQSLGNSPQSNQGIPDIAGFNKAAAQNMSSRGPMAGKAGEKQAMGGPGGAGAFAVTMSTSSGQNKVEYLNAQQLAKVLGTDFNTHTSQGPANIIHQAAVEPIPASSFSPMGLGRSSTGGGSTPQGGGAPPSGGAQQQKPSLPAGAKEYAMRASGPNGPDFGDQKGYTRIVDQKTGQARYYYNPSADTPATPAQLKSYNTRYATGPDGIMRSTGQPLTGGRSSGQPQQGIPTSRQGSNTGNAPQPFPYERPSTFYDAKRNLHSSGPGRFSDEPGQLSHIIMQRSDDGPNTNIGRPVTPQESQRLKQANVPMSQTNKFNQQLQLAKARQSNAQDRLDARQGNAQNRLDARAATSNQNAVARQTAGNENIRAREEDSAAAKAVLDFLRTDSRHVLTNSDGTTRRMNGQEEQAEMARVEQLARAPYHRGRGQANPNPGAAPGPTKVNTKADIMKLQPGTQFILPDGSVGTR